MGKMTRENVYLAVDSERRYQDAGAGNAARHADQPKAMSPGEFILCMEKCLADARAAWYKPDGGIACLDYVRKVTALGVQCMELHGAPPRAGF
jgi:hypothetical protein